MTKGKYLIDIERGHGINMVDRGLRPTIRAIVKFDGDGKVAWRGQPYFEGSEPRNMRAVAGKARNRWQAYYDRTGQRFEVEEEDKRFAKRAAAELEKVAARKVRDAAPGLLEALKLCVDALSSRGADAEVRADDRTAIGAGRKAIEAAQGPAAR